MTPICVNCGKPMFCRKTGRVLAECHGDGQVFRLRSVDEYACHGCKAAVCLIEAEPFAERGREREGGPSIDQQLARAEAAKNVVRVTYTPRDVGGSDASSAS